MFCGGHRRAVQQERRGCCAPWGRDRDADPSVRGTPQQSGPRRREPPSPDPTSVSTPSLPLPSPPLPLPLPPHQSLTQWQDTWRERSHLSSNHRARIRVGVSASPNPSTGSGGRRASGGQGSEPRHLLPDSVVGAQEARRGQGGPEGQQSLRLCLRVSDRPGWVPSRGAPSAQEKALHPHRGVARGEHER